MNRWKTLTPIWSSDDWATFNRWRRAVCVFYGCVGLILVAAWGGNWLANEVQNHAASDPGCERGCVAAPERAEIER